MIAKGNNKLFLLNMEKKIKDKIIRHLSAELSLLVITFLVQLYPITAELSGAHPHPTFLSENPRLSLKKKTRIFSQR